MSSEHRPQTPAEITDPRQIGLVADGDHRITVWKRDDALLVQVERLNQVIASLAIPTTVFDASLHPVSPDGVLLPTTLPAREQATHPEHPPITIEGYVGRTPAYRDSKHPDHKGEKELFFPMSYRPNLQNRDEVTWYDIYFYGPKAEQLNKDHYPPRGKAVRIQGTDHTHKTVKRVKVQDEGEKTIYEVHGNDVSVIKTRPQPMT